MSPAGTTILGNMLVANVCEVVCAIYVAPLPVSGQSNSSDRSAKLEHHVLISWCTAWLVSVNQTKFTDGTYGADEGCSSEVFHVNFIFNRLINYVRNIHSKF